MGGELAVELPEQRDTIGETKLGAGGGERGILRRRGTVDDEAGAGERLKHRSESRIAHRVMRPGEAPAQRQQGGGIARSKRAPSSLLVSVALRAL